VHDVVDEMEADRQSRRERAAVADLREKECSVLDCGHGKLGQDPIARCGVRRSRIATQWRGPPARWIGTATPCGVGKSVMLDGHVREQIGERPVGAGRGSVEVAWTNLCHQSDRCQYRATVGIAQPIEFINMHLLTISEDIRSVNAYRLDMAERTRPDLAAMIAALGRALTAAEQPILRAHGITMWAYVILSRLDDEPVRSQAELAESIRADKTRIIAVLDDLQRRRLITRSPDPADRRARVIGLTPKGRRLRETARSAIQNNEARVLSHLPDADRRGFLRGLEQLAALPSAAIEPEGQKGVAGDVAG